MVKILVICTANVCRSPAAQVMLTAAIRGGAEVVVGSAGTDACDGELMDGSMSALLAKFGYRFEPSHRSRALMPHHIHDHDLILCMTKQHVKRATQLQPSAVGKCLLLSHWDNGTDVEDPYGGTEDMYSDSIRIIERHCVQWAKKIVDIGMAK